MGDYSSHRWVGLSDGDGTFTFTSGTNVLPSGLGFYADWMDDHDLALTGDFNGDGLTDICGLGDTSYRRWVGLSNGDGTFSFTSGTNFLPLGLGFTTEYMDDQDRALIGDFNGDGLSDICAMGDSVSNRWVGLSVGDGTFTFASGTNVLPSELGFSAEYAGDQDQILSGDFNGDGLMDICGLGGSSYRQWVGISDGDGTFTFTSGTNFLSDGFRFSIDSDDQSRALIADFNGDGLSDICGMGNSSSYQWVGLSNGDGTFLFTYVGLGFSTRLRAGSGHQDQLLGGDFNGDGLADLCALGSSTEWLGLSRGDGTFEYTSGTNLLAEDISFSSYVSSSGPDNAWASDFNGDGLTDICALGSSTEWLGLSNGDGTFEYTEGTNFLKGLNFSTHKDSYGQTPDRVRIVDFNGDGITDICCLGSSDWIGLSGNEAARLKKVTQGYQYSSQYGVVTEINYLPITDTNIYVRGSGAEYPIRDIISPIYVVSDMIKDNGVGGTYRTQYAYRSARYHVHGRGFLGFQQFISYDYETDLCYIDTLAQDFPFTGRSLKKETVYIPDPQADPEAPGYSQRIKVVDNDWQYDLVDGGTLFTYTTQSVEAKWELGDTNAPVSVVTTYNWFDNQDVSSLPPTDQPTNLYAEITHGNLVKNIIDYGGGLKKTTLNGYDDWVDPSHWLLGRLDTSSVTHEAPGQSNVVRSSSFDYYADTGLLSQEVIEPDDPQFELVTDYYYDGFGNITNKTLTPAGLPVRTVLANDYDVRGRFVEESRNALVHPTTFINDQATGLPLSSTDPNSLTIHWLYDPTGRTVYERRPDNTVTTNQYIWDFNTVIDVPAGPDSASTISQTSAYKLHTEIDGAPPVTVWYDKQGRKIRTQTKSADGRTVNTDTGYNAIAQPIAVSEPYFTGETPVYTFTEYDGLGRPQFVTSPDGTVTETVYEGLSLSVIKDSNHRSTGEGTPKHQVTTSVKNAKGDLLSVTDAMSNTVQYVYDAVGNLIRTTDPENNVIEMRYDIRGNKIWQDDPDMGEWNYTYNALDRLTLQVDANSNRIETAYDLLGRTTFRTNWVNDPVNGLQLESTARWVYDGTGEGEKLGMLRLEEHHDGLGVFINRKRYAYDQYSRPMLELMNYDRKWYYTALEYDAFSRVEKTHRYWRPMGKEGVEHNLAPDWNVFGTQNTYNERGALLEVKDLSGSTWWEADASDYDQQNRLTQYTYGNGLVTTNEYNAETGRLEGKAIRNTQVALSAYQFEYDRIGNLTARSQARPLMTTLAETCQYDALNRLRTNAVSGITNFTATVTYDALGNITSRGQLVDYLYGSSRPHAVTRTTDNQSQVTEYFYDSNGNIVRRDKNSQYEFTARWNSFNKPVSLFAGNEGSEFCYDVSGRRTQQLIFDGTNVVKKIYATPAYEMREKLLNPEEPDRDLWEWEMDFCRIYVDTPVGKVGIYQQEGSTNGVGALTRSWMHKDHLGSVIAVSDESANLEFYSYDAWGNRRNADDWSPTENPELLTDNRTDRGYTGHEMLDNLDLVHMNGRIYDPVIGRFISPDPLIQSPDNLQSFNRYAYVWNNPLSKTDPSGFVTESTETATSSAGDYENYVEPASSTALSEQDSINSLSDEQNSETDSEYDEWMGEDGEMISRTTVAATSVASFEKETVLPVVGAGAHNDIGQNGTDTGGTPRSSSKMTWIDYYSDPLISPLMPPPGVPLDSGPPNIAKKAQKWGDHVGWVNPAGDAVGALGYLAEGKWTSAGISVASIVGLDALKFLKKGDKAVDAAKMIDNFFVPNNAIPSNLRFSRTVSADVAEGIQSGRFTMLGRMGADDVFVTASDDIAGLSRGATANRLTIPRSDAAFRLDFTLPNANGVASPVFRSNPGFIQGGRAAGGAREFVIPNLSLDSLNYTISPIR